MLTLKLRWLIQGTSLLLVVGLIVVARPANSQVSCDATVTNANGNSSAGSLKNAISSSSSGDTICFNIPGSGVHSINITSSISIGQPLIIDGTTQPGYSGSPLIEIYGDRSAGAPTFNGIVITGGSTTLKGLAVNRFKADGILIQSGGGNTIAASYIGTDATGTIDRGNASSGVGILSGNNTIGGSAAADRNVFSGNDGNSIVISGASATGNQVKGNYVGTNAAGTAALKNTADGILIVEAPNNIIGGTTGVTPGGACTGDCNLISGNGANGVGIWKVGATGNQVSGNYIGVKPSGNAPLPNTDIGVEAQDAPANEIGGVTPQERNIISGNIGAGVSLTGAQSINNLVRGNYIGVNTIGKVAIPNHKMGVNIGSPDGGSNNAHNNTIGGTTGITLGGSCTGACNVIAGNSWNGVYISGASGGSNQIIGNFIGNGASGGWTVPNVLDGIGIVNSPNNRIGNTTNNGRNIISGNKENGIAITGGSSNGTRIERNFIGTATDQNVMPNQKSGIAVGGGVDTAILTNSIYANAFTGIDLGLNGVSLNDGGDADGGPNRIQNFPSLSSASSNNGSTIISGNLNSNANTGYRIEFFYSPACPNGSRAGYGQGHAYIGSASAFTDGAGNTAFNFAMPLVPGGKVVTATATKLGGSTPFETSEFSNCVSVPRRHPDGALIRPSGSPSLFLVESGQNRPIGSVEVLISHFIALGEFKTATTSDTSAPGGPGLYFREGRLIKGSGPDVFVIDQTGPSSYQKRKITSNNAFNMLGYSLADIIKVPNSALSVASGPNISSASQHPDGTIVRSGSTIYWLENGQKKLVGSPGVYVSHRLSAAKVKNATAADLALANGGNIQYREGALLRGNSNATVFMVDHNGSTVQKRQFSSLGAFIELGYSSADVIVIPNHELPSSTGPAI